MKKSKAGKSNTPFYIALGVIAVAGIGALAYVATRPKDVATTVDPNIPAGAARAYVLGKPDAPVRVIEFADFECPACSQFATLTEPDVRKRLIEPGIISFHFYDFPLNIHRNTWHASHAAACADDQGKFWEMHDALFNGQDRWSGQATSRPKGLFEDYARAIGLNVDQWEECFDSRKHQGRIRANEQLAISRGAGQTPTFIIGDKMIGGAIGFDRFKALVDSARALVPRDTTAKGGVGGDTAKRASVPAKGPGTP